jgi:hypothetical protein
MDLVVPVCYYSRLRLGPFPFLKICRNVEITKPFLGRHIWRIYLFGDAEAKESLGPLWLPEPLKVLASVKKVLAMRPCKRAG